MTSIDGRTRLAAVLGWPVEHSRSPQLHNAAYAAAGIDAVYVALPVAPEQLAAALAGVRALRMLGVNVTVPHKHAALALCDDADELAARIGAVNTIVVGTDGRLRGHNTDCGGFADALAERNVARGRAIVLGAGGAARAVVAALAQTGHVPTVVARDPGKVTGLIELGAEQVCAWTADSLAELAPRATIVVDATSAALDPVETAFATPIPLAALPTGALVVSLMYGHEPALLVAARRLGLTTMDGASMLVHQAARAFSLMTGVPAPLGVMWAAF